MKTGLDQPRRGGRALRLSFILLGLSAIAGNACLYDADDRCRGGREFNGVSCTCPTGTVETAGECVQKIEAPSGLGAPCDAEKSCDGETFAFCQMTSDEEGYCTSHGCTADSDCGGDYYCAQGAEPTYCKRMPTGVGEQCTTQEDCASFDAGYCMQNPRDGSKVCVIANCESDTDCPPGNTCMDLSQILPGTPNICVPR